ncbi:O-fucosyltransferase 8 isoform X1 [Physcomitrium patens]|uniref:O-fucosyltransferase family protein n=1 Tax=Physcomitrium patens TaxID=3218 RepID=A0A2K1J3I2_PHYPA|nr:O-fucosyltransferase 8-like isoform X1 [Physcomitrium patens]XP_024400935.1 O-fucosyltransferase 8-like isoform X1 [Physcomitrium patens]XP_024400936.1 O-fucosyltransferase 8-like isoform X1 [Physcomitrium patens]PNR36078.1 hypothetical protein PHYPA_021928 [Physcomitrium patens]|eukprot:XP_024400934.1 O-fucosyltransferase 8-like isoform X1 [Physcomitrella patens]
MDEGNGELSLENRVADGEKQVSPVRESRLAALRRADSVLQGGYSSSGRTSPTLLQRSNSMNTEKAQWSSSPQSGVSSPTTRSRQSGSLRLQGSPSSPRSDLLSWSHSPHPRSPRALTPESALVESRGSPRFRSTTSGQLVFHQFTRSGTFSKKGRGRLLKKGGTLFFVVLFVWFALDWWYLSTFEQPAPQFRKNLRTSQANNVHGEGTNNRSSIVVYERLIALAAHGLAENELSPEPDDLWVEPTQNTTWLPCAHQRLEDHIPPPSPENSTGYIMISANGGLNQQRVAICNGVAVARLLNATLVLPTFLFNSVWRDSSQFGDIYEENYFIDYLKDDVRIVKELPPELKALDLEAIEAVMTEFDIPKEAKPSFYLNQVLPLLLRTRVVLFEGFGNRLGFDPVPFDIQRLRCRCNFHALRFVPELQKLGKVIAERMRDKHSRWGPSDDEFHVDVNKYLAGEKVQIRFAKPVAKYLAVHLRFEMDMAAYSMCDFGGGEAEREELRAYRAEHFPILAQMEKDGQLGSAELQRELGHCPLMPEEGFLMLAALGFKRGTRIYLAGSHMYGAETKMTILKSLYPNIVTKEDLLTAEELLPFRNHSSQLAALDFLGCALADAFAMTDSGSQLSSLVSGYRIYHSSGHAPTIRPNKKRLAILFDSNATIEWSFFEERVRKLVKETKRIAVRPTSRSIYRHPRCEECMCKHDV